MAASDADRTRCPLCGKFLPRGLDWAGDDWDALERAYHSEGSLESHDCAGQYEALSSADGEARSRLSTTVGRSRDGLMGQGYGLELLGTLDVAVLLGVEEGTVRKWRVRSAAGLLPVPFPPAIETSAGPVWPRAAIDRWAQLRAQGPRRRPSVAGQVGTDG